MLLNEFLNKYPNSTEGYQRRASFYMNIGDEASNKLAADDMRTLLNVSTKKDEAHYAIGKLIYNYQLNTSDKTTYADWNYNRALTEVNTALNISKEPLYYQLQGDIYFAQQKYADAFTAYSELNKTSMASATSFFSAAKAKELTEGSDKKEVISLLDSAVVRYTKPYGQDAAPFLYERARVKADANDFRGAVADYNDFYDSMLGQVSAEFYIIRMQAEMQCRMFQQAINDVNKAIEINPVNAEYWVEKGGVHIRVNQLDEAIKALEKAISLDKNNAPAYRMLGYALIQQKQKEKGLQYLNKAKELGDEITDSLLKKYGK